jgi:uncharacterized membrane protein
MSLQTASTSTAARRKHMRRIATIVRTKDRQKSRVANGSVLIAGVSGHSVWVRRAKEIIADAISDAGGEDNVSSAERSLIRRSATLTVELERLEAGFATSEASDPAALDLYQKLSNTLRRLLASLGLKRRARDVSVPSLDRYLRSRQIEAAE